MQGEANPAASDRHAGRTEGGSVASVLVALAREHVREFWHTPEAEPKPYATIACCTHHEHWPIGSRSFKQWLRKQYWDSEGKAANSQSMTDAIEMLTGMAIFEGNACSVALRVAEHGGAIFVDLCDDEWRAVRISASGWEVVTHPPVRFIRRRGMERLPCPQRGGHIDEFRCFLNVDTDSDWMLVKAWLVAALSPRGPFPLLQLSGEQGTGKSSACRLLRTLVDPSQSLIRAAPREERDLLIAANNSWVIAFDNLSGMPGWLSDAMCRLATGGGFAARQLYTDDEEVIFSCQRPAVINGIGEAASRPDLVDRCLVITLAPIPESERTTETELWRRFRQAQPRIQGGLLDLLAKALARRDTVQLPHLPRMADFAVWSTAALGEEFLSVYDANRESAVEDVLEGDILAGAVRELVTRNEVWSGTASELHDILSGMVPENMLRRREWPKSANVLSGRLRRLAPALRRVGVQVQWERDSTTSRTRMIRIATSQKSVGNLSSEPSESSGADGIASIERPTSVQVNIGPSEAEARFVEIADGTDDSDDLFVAPQSDHWEEI
ncbi:hypothetical protein Mal4_35270 [Maioricimonas rarisocia]|uniref:ATP-binding protein n=2 Tax=Maioricimonas rarisocia TaxID=2528026 RepID=A0A517Z9T1_9PLAN|nr:hypothetical protein Mal4_35270 [Maioricimonas rarisocia]